MVGASSVLGVGGVLLEAVWVLRSRVGGWSVNQFCGAGCGKHLCWFWDQSQTPGLGTVLVPQSSSSWSGGHRVGVLVCSSCNSEALRGFALVLGVSLG